MSDYSSGYNVDKRGVIAARSLYANFCITMVEVGIHLFMSLYGFSVFLESPKHLREGRRKYIVFSFLITLLSALTGGLDVAWMFQIILKAKTGTEFFDIASENLGTWDRYVSGVSVALVIFLGDVLLVYRCYIIWFHRRWVTIAPALFCFSSLVFFLLQLTVESGAVNTDIFSTVSQVLTVATNIIVTTLITFHLVRTRRQMAKALCPSTSGPEGIDTRQVIMEHRTAAETRMYTNVISILIESAFPLSVLGLAAAIFQQIPVPRHQARAEAYLVWYHLVDGLFYSFCALSPHMIIFRVTVGRSWLRSPTAQQTVGNVGSGRPMAHGEISKPINFAHSVGNVTTYSNMEESSRRSSTVEEFGEERLRDGFNSAEEEKQTA